MPGPGRTGIERKVGVGSTETAEKQARGYIWHALGCDQDAAGLQIKKPVFYLQPESDLQQDQLFDKLGPRPMAASAGMLVHGNAASAQDASLWRMQQ